MNPVTVGFLVMSIEDAFGGEHSNHKTKTQVQST